MWKYKGGGFIPGIPARDLQDSEVTTAIAAILKSSALYEYVEEKKKEKPRPSEDKMGPGPSEDKD